MKNKLTPPLLLAGLLALVVLSALGLRNRITLPNRASTLPACGFKKVTCMIDPQSMHDKNFSIHILQNGTSVAKGSPGDTSIMFSASTSSAQDQFQCEIIGLTQWADGSFVDNPSCRTSITNTVKCLTPTDGPPPPTLIHTPSNTPPPNNPTPEILASCACTEGGTLDCSDRTEDYVGKDGPGLVIINPKYNGDACFSCEWLVLHDETKEVARYDCSGYKPGDLSLLPTPTVIRLHQARGELCRNYSISVIGKTANGPTPKPEVCGNCSGKVCCPTCSGKVVKTGCGDFTDGNGKKFTCDFNLDNGATSCPKVGTTVKVTILGNDGRKYDVDFDDIDNPSIGLTHEYDDAGVYDIALSCEYYGGTLPQYQVCKQRVTVSCSDTVTPPPTTPEMTLTVCPEIKIIKPMCIYKKVYEQ